MPSTHQPFTQQQVVSKNTFEIYHCKGEYNKEVALHHHDYYEIYFFISGNVNYNIESRNYLLTPGDILLINPMELHQPIFGKDRFVYERYVLLVNANFMEQLNQTGSGISRCFDTTRPGHINMIRPDGTKREYLRFLMSMLLQECHYEEFASEMAAMALFAQIMVFLNRLAIQGECPVDIKSESDSVVYQVHSYINEHYNEDLSLDFLANKFFISKYHLSREFNRLVGTSVYRYITQKRLVMAKQMLSTGIPATVVYQHCGFSDYSNFYRAFKAEYQISPREFVEGLHANILELETLRLQQWDRVKKKDD